MPEYDNTNNGVLFRNENKEQPNQPDYRGSLDVEGVDYWISAWIKTAGAAAKNPGSKFMSLALTLKEEKPKPAQRRELNEEGDGYDDIPF